MLSKTSLKRTILWGTIALVFISRSSLGRGQLTEPKPPGGANTTKRLLTLEPIAQGFASLFQSVTARLTKEENTGPEFRNKVKTLYGDLLQLQQAREGFLQALHSYITALEQQSQKEKLASARWALVSTTATTRKGFLAVDRDLKEIQVELNLSSNEADRSIGRYLSGQSPYLFRALDLLSLDELKEIALQADANSIVIADAIAQLRTFLKHKYPDLDNNG
jgi:hypothetical protein